MADLSIRHPDNVSGKWYVDKNCILCNLCVELAPKNFKKSELGEYTVVVIQPSSSEELDNCEEAMLGCPVEAIGKDGAEIAPQDLAVHHPTPQPDIGVTAL